MRKLFLIPLMSLLTCVMAWGATVTVGTFDALQNALSAANDGDVIELTADITWTDHSQSLLINKSISLDGKGKKITGYGDKQATLKIIGVENSQPTVAISNLTIDNKGGIAILIGGYLDSLCIENSTIESSASISGNPRAIEFAGPQTAAARIGIKNSVLKTTWSGYPLRSYNPMILYMSNSKTSGYCALNFQPNFNTSGTVPPIDGYIGTRGTKVYATNCDFDAPNIHNGESNGFACFALRDDGIDFHLTNCGMNAEVLGNANQQAFDLGGWWAIKDRLTEVLSPESKHDINITIDGDNSHINGDLIASMLYVGVVPTTDGKFYFMSETGFTSNYTGTAPSSYMPESAFQYKANINFTITGGTYAINPEEVRFHGHILLDQLTDEEKASDPDNYSDDKFEALGITIPDDYEVKTVTMEGVTTPLYRVVKRAARDGENKLYDLNDNVQSQGDGQNPTTSFELSDGSAMTLEQPTTKAGYVEVSGGTTVTVATDQTLVINNGLDVQGASVVTAKPGSALVIGEGGIVTKSSSSIVVEANQNGAASLLLDPAITVNQTPELTVKMTVPAEHAGYEMQDETKFRHWHRFAMPVEHDDAWEKDPNIGTYLYGWDYSAQKWAQVSVSEMVPFAGYTLSPDREITNETGAITYTFQGKLMGNTNSTLELSHHGYNFFGNSYTGYISILKLVDQIMGDAKIDGTVWMWDGEKYEGVSLANLREREVLYENWQKEVAPMQTFVLRLTGAETSSTDINYADAIWGNPRYESSTGASAAPARRAAINDDAIIRMTIAANGQKESVILIESGDYSDAYDRGYDAVKFMNDNSFNAYVGVNGENYGTVATDNLEGKMLNIKTNNELAYSLSFDFVAGEEYALRDNVTGKVIAIEEGTTYEFAAQPNSTVEGRFQIINRFDAPTAIENTEVKANVKGIYSITGMYLGEDFNALPAGVYVVDGVKIVK